MPRGGRLTIETANVVLTEEYSERHHRLPPGQYVLLAVSDTGVGMDEATQKHLFEPFFTTKAVGEGTGLGLAAVYGIVKQSGGQVWVRSEPGRGATFRLYFPQSQQALAEPEPGSEALARGGSERVLVVEDDPAVRTLRVRALKPAGYAGDVAICGG